MGSTVRGQGMLGWLSTITGIGMAFGGLEDVGLVGDRESANYCRESWVGTWKFEKEG